MKTKIIYKNKRFKLVKIGFFFNETLEVNWNLEQLKKYQNNYHLDFIKERRKSKMFVPIKKTSSNNTFIFFPFGSAIKRYFSLQRAIRLNHLLKNRKLRDIYYSTNKIELKKHCIGELYGVNEVLIHKITDKIYCTEVVFCNTEMFFWNKIITSNFCELKEDTLTNDFFNEVFFYSYNLLKK